jgi:hypothetical protein
MKKAALAARLSPNPLGRVDSLKMTGIRWKSLPTSSPMKEAAKRNSFRGFVIDKRDDEAGTPPSV